MGDPVELSSLTSHLTCKLCTGQWWATCGPAWTRKYKYCKCTTTSGYLIEATTIIECLHTFCKSCIVRYLDDDNKCPVCQIQIHQSHPLSYVMLDRKMQDVVFKAVPGLQAREEERIKQFYQQRDLPIPDQEVRAFRNTLTPMVNGGDTVDGSAETKAEKGSDCNYHRDDQQVSIVMSEGDHLPSLQKKYLHCSIYTTIKTLKRYVSQHLYGNTDEHVTLDIFCQKELMGKDHTLEFVLKTRWRSKEPPLQLEYHERVDMI